MKTLKSIFLLFLTAAISIGTVACSSSTTTPSPDESQNSESQIDSTPTTESGTEEDASSNDISSETLNQEESTNTPESSDQPTPPINNTDDISLTDIPKFTGGKYSKTYNIGDETSQLYYTRVNKESIADYVSLLSSLGYEKVEENATNDNLFISCYGKNGLVHLSYLNYNKTLSVILDPLKNSVYKIAEPEYQKVTDTSLAIMSLDYENTEATISENVHDASGMSYVVTLEDGRYVIFDGGYWHKSSNGAARDACALYNFLKDNNKRPDKKIVIAAWIFTHDHSDHHGAFSTFCDYGYADKVELQYYIQNFGDKSRYKQQPSGWLSSGIPDLIKENFKDAKKITPHTGQKITFCNTTFELVSSHENHVPSLVEWVNDASLIFRMEANGIKTLFLADAEAQTTRSLVNIYDASIKSDIVQVAHHGYSGGSINFYKLVAPSYSLWSTSQSCFEERTTGGGNGNAQAQNQWLRENTTCYVGDGDIEILTFIGGTAKITTEKYSPNWCE